MTDEQNRNKLTHFSPISIPITLNAHLEKSEYLYLQLFIYENSKSSSLFSFQTLAHQDCPTKTNLYKAYYK